jgi:NitT/TauT family transport system substrate-binding protein
VAGTVQVCQSAPSQGFGALEKGQLPSAVHFAQINEMDGFFLTGRAADPGFTWDKLKGRRVLVDHGGQPLAMFTYACHRRGLDFAAIQAVNVPSDQMDAAFRRGEGDYIRAYRRARAWLLATPAAEVAKAEAGFFPEIDPAVLAATIAYYQKLGCWTPHAEITRPAFEAALDVFQHSRLITRQHRYEDVVAPPPAAA